MSDEQLIAKAVAALDSPDNKQPPIPNETLPDGWTWVLGKNNRWYKKGPLKTKEQLQREKHERYERQLARETPAEKEARLKRKRQIGAVCRKRCAEERPDDFAAQKAHRAEVEKKARADGKRKSYDERKVEEHAFVTKVHIAARDKNIDQQLTAEEILELARNSRCTYCNSSTDNPSQGTVRRVNINEGFTHDNVHMVCSMCSNMQGVQDCDVFIARCHFIVKYRDLGIPLILKYPNLYQSSEVKSMSRWLGSVNNRAIKCVLSQQEWKRLFFGTCYYCGQPDSNGIDRVDSNGEYTMENCVSCCWGCNHHKKAYSYDQLIAKVREVVAHCPLPQQLETQRPRWPQEGADRPEKPQQVSLTRICDSCFMKLRIACFDEDSLVCSNCTKIALNKDSRFCERCQKRHPHNFFPNQKPFCKTCDFQKTVYSYLTKNPSKINEYKHKLDAINKALLC